MLNRITCVDVALRTDTMKMKQYFSVSYCCLPKAEPEARLFVCLFVFLKCYIGLPRGCSG